MKLKVKVIIYVLTDAQGNISHSVIGDYTNSICVGGIGSDGKHHQYDSYEGYHCYEWANERGMSLDCYEKEIELTLN